MLNFIKKKHYFHREGALKLKTTGFLQAEAFSSGEMKHGPIALIDPETEGQTKGKKRDFSKVFFLKNIQI